MERFMHHHEPGTHPDSAWLASLSDEELALEIANNGGPWFAPVDLFLDLIWRAHRTDPDYEQDEELVTILIDAAIAADMLGVNIEKED